MKKFLLSLAAMAMMATSANAMYILGTGEQLGDWTLTKGAEMTEKKTGVWEWTGTITDSQWFCFATQLMDEEHKDDWDTFHTTYRLAPQTNGTVAEAGEYELVHQNASFKGCGLECTYTITKDGDNYKLNVAPTGETPEDPETPEDVKYYAVGAFQGWEPSTPTEFGEENGIFTFVAKNASAIKISTTKGDWDTFNSGTIGPKNKDYNYEEGPFEYVKFANYQFTFAYEATWTITIDPSNKTMQFSTTDPKPTTPIDIYLRGDMNGWNAVDEWKFNTTDGVIYTLANVNIEASQGFKVADASWGSINFGYNDPVEPNSEVVLYNTQSNIKLTKSVTNATVEFNLDTKAFSITGTTGVDSLDKANEPAVYFNLQGAKVEKGTKGILIRVTAGKAEKVIVK